MDCSFEQFICSIERRFRGCSTWQGDAGLGPNRNVRSSLCWMTEKSGLSLYGKQELSRHGDTCLGLIAPKEPGLLPARAEKGWTGVAAEFVQERRALD